MHEIWNRIEAWCHTYAPEVLEGMNPGATEEQIRKAESFLGVTFPEDVRELYRLHNGQRGWDVPSLLYGEEFLPLGRIQGEWRVWKELLDSGTFADVTSEPPPGVRNDWWNPAWIPITHDGGGNHYCLDFSPAEGGTVGQIIRMWHDDPDRGIAALSIREWLEIFADKLESGEYIYSPEEYAGVVPYGDISEDEEWRGVGR